MVTFKFPIDTKKPLFAVFCQNEKTAIFAALERDIKLFFLSMNFIGGP
jgi:hypothetical protein